MLKPEKEIEKEFDLIEAALEALVSAFQFQVNWLKQGEVNTNRVRAEALKASKKRIKSPYFNDLLAKLQDATSLDEQEKLISQAFELIKITVSPEVEQRRLAAAHAKWIQIKFEFLKLYDEFKKLEEQRKVTYDYLLSMLEYVAELVKEDKDDQRFQDVLDDLFSFSAHAPEQSELIMQIRNGIEDIRSYMVIPKKSERMLKIRTKFVALLNKIPSDGAKKKITV